MIPRVKNCFQIIFYDTLAVQCNAYVRLFISGVRLIVELCVLNVVVDNQQQVNAIASRSMKSYNNKNIFNT